MTVFYTGKGDAGKSVMGGSKIAKDDILFDVLGSFDEVNSLIGWCRAEAVGNKKLGNIAQSLLAVQEGVFMAQAEVGALGMRQKSNVQITKSKTQELEDLIDAIDHKLPPIKNFIIPGASELSARLDIARAAARRAERLLVAYARKHKISPDLTQYMNRLSSILFALARMVNFRLKLKEANPKYK
jgi:cob(I)alamin adenosyltransferase